MAFLGDLMRALLPQPKGYQDYYHLHGWLIYKKAIPLLLLPVLVLLLIATLVLGCWLNERAKEAEIPVFYEFDEALGQYSGKAVLLDRQGRTVYQGPVVQGMRSGSGREYSPLDGSLVYEGGFSEGRYQGHGVLYKKEKLLYEGDFSGGLYSGEGMLYNRDGGLLYKGQFVKGEYQGSGTLYQEGELPLYEGGFLLGRYEGEGILYHENGEEAYSGGFSRGLFEGHGRKYSPEGALVYQGDFHNGLYDGQGVLYAQDGKRPLIEGSFVRGAATGPGKLYNEQGQLLYSGGLCDGQADYISLLGLPMQTVAGLVLELPLLYFGNGYVGYLYQELGFALISRYDYSSFQQLGAQDFYNLLVSGASPAGDSPSSTDESAPQVPEGTELFASAQDNLVADVLLVQGSRLQDQLPPPNSSAAFKTELTGFEAFMESRVASLQNPTARLAFSVPATRRGDHLYEVAGLPEAVPYDSVGLYQDSIRYFYRKGSLDKGGVPAVVVCNKARLGG